MIIGVHPIAFVKNDIKATEDRIPHDTISEIEIIEDLPYDCLKGIEGFSHLEIIFHFHKATKIVKGKAHPRNNKSFPKVGIFAHRRKDRPNHIGLSTVKLIKKEKRKLIVLGLDALDGTPVLDIKPVVNRFLPKGDVKEPSWVNDENKK